ncbi:condensation domain-containing protein, partial [Actinophytocola sediminis]
GGPPSAERGQLHAEVDRDATGRLAGLGREWGVTVASIVHAAWGMLLAAECGRDDVVFGTTVSVRSARVAGVAELVGPVVNTIPVRVLVDRASPVASVVSAVHAGQARLAAHQHLGLGDVQRLAGWPEPFDTLVVFENTALQPGRVTAGPDAPRVAGVEVVEDSHYTFSVVVTPGERLVLRATYRPELLAPDRAEALLARLRSVVCRLGAQPRASVADVLD